MTHSQAVKPPVDLMSVASTLCSFSFQLVEPIVGGPDVFSLLSAISAAK